MTLLPSSSLLIIAHTTARPYKDPLLITGQAISFVALMLSFGFIFTWFFGLVAWLMLTIAFCCRMNKCGFITAGVFGILAGVGSLIAGISILTTWGANFCYGNRYSDDDIYYYYDDDDYYSVCNFTLWGWLSLIGGALWLTSSILVFVFTCGSRIDKYKTAELDEGHNDIPAVATIMAPPSPTGSTKKPRSSGRKKKLTSVTTITMMLDGSQQTEVRRTNADGSASITTTIKPPQPDSSSDEEEFLSDSDSNV
jgi:hypothetical protein